MHKLLLKSLFLFGLVAVFSGCSERQPTVVVDERSEAEQQAAYDEYDKQIEQDGQSYK